MKTCACCKQPIREQKCTYCGFITPDIQSAPELANESNAFIDEQANDHRIDFLKNIRGVSIRASVFQFDSNQGSFGLQDDPKELFPANLTGQNLYGKTVWSDEWIANPKSLDLIGKKQTIPFSYEIGGETIEDAFTITPEDTEGIVCKLGLMMDDELHLNLFLGDEDNIRGQSRVKIKWLKK